jgi:hypothetical protein
MLCERVGDEEEEKVVVEEEQEEEGMVSMVLLVAAGVRSRHQQTDRQTYTQKERKK